MEKCYSVTQKEQLKFFSDDEIWNRVFYAINNMGYLNKSNSHDVLLDYRIVNRAISHKRQVPFTMIVLLKMPSSTKYSVHYLFSYGEEREERQSLDSGSYDLSLAEAMEEFYKRIENEKKWRL